MELYKKIRARREELGMSQEELATKLGYKSRSTINKIEMGKNDITQSKIKAFAEALQTTPGYLMGYDTSLPDGVEPYNPIMHRIPILGNIAAGLPLFAEENIEGYTYTELNHGSKYFALRIKGDSMTAANIPDGSLVTVRSQPQVENGEIAAVRVNDDSFTVKRFKQNDNIVTLTPQSYNPKHQVQIYDLTKDKIDIIGKVVECKVEF